MSGFDRIQYFTLERLLSSDMNADARLRSRNVVELMRMLGATVALNADNDAIVDQSVSSKVFGGLRVSTGAGGVTVLPGILGQYWSGGGTQPSSDESQYVFGELRVAQLVPIAVPGADTWYLVQARATVSVTNAMRDEWNPGTNSFSGVAVGYKLENTVEFNVKTGTATNMPLPDAGWIPLAGVKRLASGVDSTSKEMIDLRPLYDRREISVQTRGVGIVRTNMVTSHYNIQTNVPGNTISFNCEAVSDIGNMFARVNADGFIDITSAPFIDPTTVLAANTWYYVYLANWAQGAFSGILPRGAYNNIVHQGILLLSHVPPPAQGSNDMPDGVTYPAPFGQDPSRVGVCIMCIRRNGSNDGWNGQQIIESRLENFTQLVLAAAASPVTIGANLIPVNARNLTMNVGMTSGTSTSIDIKQTPAGPTMRRVLVQGLFGSLPVTVPLSKIDPSQITIASNIVADGLSAVFTGVEL